MARLRFLSWPPWGSTAFWEGQSQEEGLPYSSSAAQVQQHRNSSISFQAPIFQAQTPGSSVSLSQVGATRLPEAGAVQRAGKSRIPAITSLGLSPSSFSAPQRQIYH